MYLVMYPEVACGDTFKSFIVKEPLMAEKFLKRVEAGYQVYKLDLPRVTKMENHITTVLELEEESEYVLDHEEDDEEMEEDE